MSLIGIHESLVAKVWTNVAKVYTPMDKFSIRLDEKSPNFLFPAYVFQKFSKLLRDILYTFFAKVW